MPNDYSVYRRFLILNMINRFGPISRTGLIKLTDSRPASIGELTKELLDDKLIVETGQVTKGQGRRRLLVDINRKYICAITLSITMNSVTYVVSQIDGTVIKQVKQTEPTSVTSMENYSKRILDYTVSLCREFSDRMIIGIGICDPLYDPARYQATGTLLSGYLHFNDWLHDDLQPQLEKITGIPVSSFSPVTLPALAEKRYGAAKDSQNFICVELSNGVGSSFCCNGQVVSGADGVAGELGHTVVNRSEKTICYCGKPGCVESVTAFPALVRKIRAALDSGVLSSVNTYHDPSEPITVADIRRAIEDGDAMCRLFVRQSAEEIGVAVANAVMLLNPDLVILYGFMTELGDYFLEHLEASIRENTLVLSRNFKIVLSSSHESIHPLGAAAELFSSFLRMGDYSWIYNSNSSHPDLDPEEA